MSATDNGLTQVGATCIRFGTILAQVQVKAIIRSGLVKPATLILFLLALAGVQHVNNPNGAGGL